MSTSGIDFTKPNAARVHDTLLGGHDNFAPDRALAGRLLEICPDLRGAVRENRAFITRAVTWAAGQGVIQFADLGAGLPMPRRGTAAREIHETAHAATSSARVVYVDNDPVVFTHSRAFRAHVRRGENMEPAQGVAVAEAPPRQLRRSPCRPAAAARLLWQPTAS
jgi:S-adenosyl methyltransferase